MQEFLRIFLPVAFILFNFVCVFWRVKSFKRQTGKNPIVIGSSDTAHGYAGLWYKIVILLIGLNIALFSARPSLFSSGLLQVWSMPDVIFFLGLLVDLISFYLIAIGQIQMGQSWRIGFDTKEKTELVRLGLYGYSRNPIYVGMMLSFLGNFLLLPNSISLLTCVMSFVLLQILTRLEEAHLSMLHGNPYLEYCRQVRRWF